MTVHFQAKIPGEGMRDSMAESFQFPGGEWHLRDFSKLLKDPRVIWIADLRGADANDLVQAAMWADIAHGRQAPFVLFLPYLPAARADRDEPLGCRVYANLINAMNPQQVIAIDPHSPMIARYLKNLTVLDSGSLVQRALRETRTHYQGVIAPDKGARTRAREVAQLLGVNVATAEKHREFVTGRIEGIEMIDRLDRDKTYLVVDDICDGGRTFVELAEATGLPKEQLGLWVTHGIFSGRADQLREHYSHIYTSDSHPGHNRVGVATYHLPVWDYLYQNLKDFG